MAEGAAVILPVQEETPVLSKAAEAAAEQPAIVISKLVVSAATVLSVESVIETATLKEPLVLISAMSNYAAVTEEVNEFPSASVKVQT